MVKDNHISHCKSLEEKQKVHEEEHSKRISTEATRIKVDKDLTLSKESQEAMRLKVKEYEKCLREAMKL